MSDHGEAPQPFRVLVVEDDPADIEAIRTVIDGEQRTALSMETCTSLADALRVLGDHRPDAVLLDLNLPDSSGIDTFERLRRSAPDTPVVILTGRDERDLAVRCIARGAQDFLLKSRTTSQISDALLNAIARAEAQQTYINAQASIERLVTDSQDAILVLDADHHVLFANPAAIELFGGRVGPGQLFGAPVTGTGPHELQVPHADAVRTVEMLVGETTWNGDPASAVTLRDVTERNRTATRLEHLNQVLRAIRNVNQLIIQEKDPATLVRRACELLVEDRGYRGAWLAVGDGESPATAVAHAGWEKEFDDLSLQLRGGDWPPCRSRAHAAADGIVMLDPASLCPSCPIATGYQGHPAVITELRYRDEVLGLLGVAFPKNMAFDDEERSLLVEVAGDLAFALHDIESERRRRAGERLLTETGHMARVGGWEVDVETERVWWSTVTREIHEAADDFQPKLGDAIDFFHPEDRPRLEAAIAAALEHGEPYDLELRFVTGRGNELWVHTRCTPVVEDGRVVKLLGTFQDVTGRRLAEDELRASEERYRLLADNTVDCIWLMSLDGRFEYVNPAVFDILGYTPNEVVGTPLSAYCDEANFEVMSREIAAALADPAGFERTTMAVKMIRRGGSPVDVEITGKLLLDDDGHPTGLQGVTRDISDRVASEAAVRASEQRFRALFEQSLAPIVIADDDGRYLDVNPAACAMFGYDREQFLTMNVSDLVTIASESAAEQFESYRQTKSGQGEFPFISADGEHRIALWSATEIAPGQHASVLRDVTELTSSQRRLEAEKKRAQRYLDVAAIMLLGLDRDRRITLINPRGCKILGIAGPEEALGDDWLRFIPPADHGAVKEIFQTLIRGEDREFREVEGRVLTAAGEERTIVWHNALVRDDDGAVVGTLSSGEDVTARRASEATLAETEAMLRQAQRMEAVGRLAGGIAHDFNNILMVINSHAEFAAEAVGDDHPVHDDIDQIQKAGERAAHLTSQLLAFSRKQMIDPQVLDLNEVLREMQSMLRRLIGEDVELNVNLAPDLGAVKADPGQIEQVLMNLAVNARDAMPAGGTLTIETDNVTLDDGYAESHPETTPGRFVMMAVSDDGVGMDEAIREAAFEPFFTTKEHGKGTGLGLATVHGIVKQSGGNVWVYSEPGKGTVFKIHLPRIDERASQPGANPEIGDLRGDETILVVEDEHAVRTVMTRILSAAGYRVIAATGGGEALAECERCGGDVDLVVTDVVMPGMSGRELADQLAEKVSALKVLYMSGYTENAIVHHGVLDEGIRFIGKPFSVTELLRKVRTVLDSD